MFAYYSSPENARSKIDGNNCSKRRLLSVCGRFGFMVVLPNRRKAIWLAPKRFAWPFPVCRGDSRICGECGGRGRGFGLGRIRAASNQSSRFCGHWKPVRGRCSSGVVSPGIFTAPSPSHSGIEMGSAAASAAVRCAVAPNPDAPTVYMKRC